jgi:Tfp pilus assembly protein PilN
MIKVNLLRDIGGGAAGAVNPGGISMETVAQAGDESGGGTDFDVAVKLIILILPFALLYGWRSYTEGQLKAQNNQLQARLSEINTKLASYEPALKDIEKFQEEKRKLDSQMDVIKKLMKDRIKPLKTLANLQEILPARLWLTKYTMGDGKFSIEGIAMDDGVVSDFVGALEASVYFQNVKIEGISKGTYNSEPVKNYKLSGDLENPPQ